MGILSESGIVKVLVMGHRGFLGAAFCERFAQSYDFVGYDLKDGDDLHDLDRLGYAPSPIEYTGDLLQSTLDERVR